MNLSSPIVTKYFDNNGQPLAGGLLFTYADGTQVKQATYQNQSGTPNTNPIELNARGECDLWTPIDAAYTMTLSPPGDTDPPSNPIFSKDHIRAPLVLTDITQALIGSVFYPRTAVEIAAGVTPVNYQYPQGHLYRYGTNTTPGTTDMTTAAQNWAVIGGNLVMPLPDVVLVSAVIPLVSNTTMSLVEGATFKTNTAGLSVFKATSKSNIVIRGGKIQQTANSSAVAIGLVEFNACTYCKAEGIELVGAQGRGVLLSGSSYCRVASCYIHDSLGSTTADVDSCDIAVYGASSFNVIVDNVCYGSTAVEHGIMIQDPGGSLLPLKNIVANNRVGPHKSYGILNYLIDHANTWCQIIGNEVEGITGTAQSGGSGSGIYNQGAGGTIIANNIIRNCCINTTAFSLIPAGIDLNLDAAMMPVQVIGNHVSDIANGSAGISVTTGPANIVGNTVVQSTGMVTAVGIYLNSASNVSATDNHVTIATSIASSTGIFSYTNGASSSNVKISDNTVKGASAYSIRVDQTGGTTTTNVVVDGNQISGGSSACIGLGLYSIINGAVNGNTVSATTVAALDLSACTFTRFSGNTLITTGTTGVNTQGTCTNSFFDQSNTFSGNAVNAATGLIVERRSSAVPSAGTAAVGDTWLQTAPTAATSPGGMCVTAGSPGTWKGFAALAA